ncbi:MAG: hypothetical protein IKP92_02965 [Lachnospiraceae bacterium]|nr:hypothetical protein [Lachnospiraceae bacterium]
MKKLVAASLIGALVLSLAACSNAAPETEASEIASQVASEVVSEAVSEAVSEVASEAEEVIDKPDFTGTYTEPVAGRCTIEIESVDGDNYKVIVRWASSAFESSNWEMDATYYVSTGLLEYTNAKFYVRTYTDEENFTDDVKYTDGAGEFWFEEDGSLGWRSANSDVDGIDGETFFERVEIVE